MNSRWIAAGTAVLAVLSTVTGPSAQASNSSAASPAVISAAIPSKTIPSITIATAAPKISLITSTATVAADRVVMLSLKCSATATCSGSIRLVVGEAVGKAVTYSVPAKKTAVKSLTIGATQLKSLQDKGTLAVTVHLQETKPATVARRAVKLTLKAANPTPGVTVATASASVGLDQLARVGLRCKGSAACTGRIAVIVGSTKNTAVGYSIAKGGTAELELKLNSVQFTALKSARTLTAQVAVAEVKPNAIAARSSSLALTYTPPDPVPSQAYLNRNWVPTVYDTCPEALHRSYSVVGPDGKLYPGWHPPEVVDPATGRSCTFGHEHGDDPFSSDIYGWVSDFLAAPDYRLKAGIPFGYVSESLVDYAGANAGQVTRHEDNVGHKIFVRNNVKLISANPRAYVKVPDATGVPQTVTCDYLIKIHQGSHSADATINNAHELLYAVKCTDGTELISLTMSRFGDANEFNRSCAPSTLITTTGSNLPDGSGGRRLIADRDCVKDYVLVNPASPSAYSDLWSMYEVWESANQLTTEQGAVIADFDPWFAVRNPSRYFWPAKNGDGSNGIGYSSNLTWETDASDNGRVNAEPWSKFALAEPFLPTDPRSAFDGAQRDFYLRSTSLANAGGSEIWFTDPWGGSGRQTPFTGSVRQWVSSIDNTAYPSLERQKFGHDVHYGLGHGVHAPN